MTQPQPDLDKLAAETDLEQRVRELEQQLAAANAERDVFQDGFAKALVKLKDSGQKYEKLESEFRPKVEGYISIERLLQSEVALGKPTIDVLCQACSLMVEADNKRIAAEEHVAGLREKLAAAERERDALAERERESDRLIRVATQRAEAAERERDNAQCQAKRIGQWMLDNPTPRDILGGVDKIAIERMQRSQQALTAAQARVAELEREVAVLRAACQDGLQTLTVAVRAGIDEASDDDFVDRCVDGHVTLRKLRSALAATEPKP